MEIRREMGKDRQTDRGRDIVMERETVREGCEKKIGDSPGVTVVECDCVETSLPDGQLPTYRLPVGVHLTQWNEHFRLPLTPSFLPSVRHPEVNTLCGETLEIYCS